MYKESESGMIRESLDIKIKGSSWLDKECSCEGTRKEKVRKGIMA